MLLFIVLPVIISIVSAGFIPPPALTYTASAISYPEVYGYAATPVVKAPAYHLTKSVPYAYSVAAAPVIKAAPPLAYAPAPAYAAAPAPAYAAAPAIAAAPPPAYAAYPATYGSYLR